MPTNLTEQDVRKRLASYEDSTVTDELYTFGKMLTDDAIERLSKSDAKAGAIAAYSGGLIALLASTSPMWATHLNSRQIAVPVFALLSLFLSAALSVFSMSPRKTEWHSTNEWMKEGCLTTGERLRRYHLLTMWGAYESLNQVYVSKAFQVKCATACTIVSWILLAATFFQITSA